MANPEKFDTQVHNLREMIRNLEYLLEVAETPDDRARYRQRLEQSKKQLESMLGTKGETTAP
jgi:hypothetical protein